MIDLLSQSTKLMFSIEDDTANMCSYNLQLED